MEHTARLRIVKNALVHLLQKEAAGESQEDAFQWLIEEWAMPHAFQDGMETLQQHEYRNRIPFLWQLFIEVFGGFYCLTDPCDITVLAECTKIPQERIPECLELYAKFFPTNSGWFYSPKSQLRVMKNVPGVYHGTGAFLRSSLFDPGEYTRKLPDMAWLVEKWYRALYELLEPELAVGAPKG